MSNLTYAEALEKISDHPEFRGTNQEAYQHDTTNCLQLWRTPIQLIKATESIRRTSNQVPMAFDHPSTTRTTIVLFSSEYWAYRNWIRPTCLPKWCNICWPRHSESEQNLEKKSSMSRNCMRCDHETNITIHTWNIHNHLRICELLWSFYFCSVLWSWSYFDLRRD